MDKLLFISAHSPSPYATMAGHKIAFERLTHFSQNFSVDVIIIANEDEIDIAPLASLKNVNIVMTRPLDKWKKLKNILFSRHIFPLKCTTRFDKNISHFLQKHKNEYRQIHFEFTHAAVYCRYLNLSKNKLSITVHDVLLQQKLRSYSTPLDLIDTQATFHYEQEVFNKMDTIYALCNKDRELLASMYSIPKSCIEVISPALSKFVNKVADQREKSKIDKRSLLFWGAMNRQENEDAIIAFIKRYKLLLETHDIKLYIVGNKPSEKIKQLASSNIIVTGFVEDPSSYFLKATIGIVPLLYGAGIKIKTLEMLKCGLPVLSTDIGAEGIENNNLQIAPLDEFEYYLLKMLRLES